MQMTILLVNATWWESNLSYPNIYSFGLDEIADEIIDIMGVYMV